MVESGELVLFVTASQDAASEYVAACNEKLPSPITQEGVEVGRLTKVRAVRYFGCWAVAGEYEMYEEPMPVLK